jgi:hypothetical protein
MSHDLICAWLGLPVGEWPPDHYTLLGLKLGENDATLIEERVHERLDTVRRYQMIHPDQATEAMNRIAQAFVCLSEPASKRVYDVGLLGAAAADQPQAVPQNGAGDDRDPLVLVYNPTSQETAPPIRLQYDPTNQSTAPPIRVQYGAVGEEILPPVRRAPVAEVVADAIPVAIPLDEAPQAIPVEVLPEPPPVPRAQPTKRDLYRRIVEARRLSESWKEVGKYLGSPKRRLTRVAEVNDLVRQLVSIRERLASFPPLLGAAGQPGYQVLALGQLTSASPFLGLEPSQREALSADWQAGQSVLEAYRNDLRQQARALHKRDPFQRLGRAIRSVIVDRPGWILVLIAVIVLNLAIVRTYVIDWVEDAAAKVISSTNGK